MNPPVRITLTCRTSPPEGTSIILQKEPGNTFNNEAIAVKIEGNPLTIGFVAATYKTRKPNTVSAGQIYDRFEQSIVATVVSPNVAEITFQ